jgi:hypothetical protein
MEKIWYKDITGFINDKNFMIFFPSADMSLTEQLNSLMRLSIYFAIVMFLLKKDTNIFFAPIFMALFSFLIYNVDKKNKLHDQALLNSIGMKEEYCSNDLCPKSRELCQKPTRHNPFMNVLISDYANNTDRPRACKIQGRVKKDIKDNFDVNLYRDIDDVFHKKASDRQFYTTPSTTIPNDASAYAEWLYGTGKTCKEGNGDKCFANLHSKQN